MFSCELCKIFRNTYFEEHLRATASEKDVMLIKSTEALVNLKNLCLKLFECR